MIPPYPGPTVFHFGPLAFPVFGLLVMTGILAGHAVAVRFAERRGIAPAEIRAAAAWAVGAGFVGAHVFDVLVSHPDQLRREGIVALLRFWQGISSYGGFLGALAGVAFYFGRLRKSWWTHADALVQGLCVGWLFGRLGCTLTSDHLGTRSDFVLAFDYASGARHNLGFYEFVYTGVVLLPCMLLLRRYESARGAVPGIYVAALCGLYAPARFVLDFLRARDVAIPDPRFFGLTAAQYASAALFVFAVMVLHRIRNAARAARR